MQGPHDSRLVSENLRASQTQDGNDRYLAPAVHVEVREEYDGKQADREISDRCPDAVKVCDPKKGLPLQTVTMAGALPEEGHRGALEDRDEKEH